MLQINQQGITVVIVGMLMISMKRTVMENHLCVGANFMNGANY